MIDYVEIAHTHGLRVLMRWLIENGPPLDAALVTKLVTEKNCDAEIAYWLTENQRTRIVCDALRTGSLKCEELVAWVVGHTTFEHAGARAAIRRAMETAPEIIADLVAASIDEAVLD